MLVEISSDERKLSVNESVMFNQQNAYKTDMNIYIPIHESSILVLMGL